MALRAAHIILALLCGACGREPQELAPIPVEGTYKLTYALSTTTNCPLTANEGEFNVALRLASTNYAREFDAYDFDPGLFEVRSLRAYKDDATRVTGESWGSPRCPEYAAGDPGFRPHQHCGDIRTYLVLMRSGSASKEWRGTLAHFEHDPYLQRTKVPFCEEEYAVSMLRIGDAPPAP